MTLDTRVYVTAPVDPHNLFHACQLALSLYDDQQREPGKQKWSDKPASYYPGRLLSNEPMQDLPGWLMLHYRETGMYRTPEDSAEHLHCNHPASGYFDRGAEICDEAEHDPACWVEISIDTAYGYRDRQGRGCGALHAELVDLIGAWLDERQISWRWMNEFTGQVFNGRDGLHTLGQSGEEAREWFTNRALPVILAHMQDGAS